MRGRPVNSCDRLGQNPVKSGAAKGIAGVLGDLLASGKECSVTVRNVLKPGKREYIFTTGGGTAYCDKPRIERTACQAF